MLSNLDSLYNNLLNAGVQAVVALPDSLLSPICQRIQQGDSIRYIQVTHETDCVGISTGLNLSGIRTLGIMENSGIRNACEILTRFHLSHHLFSCYLISHRGSYGERNWWGLAHHDTLLPLLKLLRFRWVYLHSISTITSLVKMSFDMYDTGQTSTVIIAEPDFIKQIKK